MFAVWNSIDVLHVLLMVTELSIFWKVWSRLRHICWYRGCFTEFFEPSTMSSRSVMFAVDLISSPPTAFRTVAQCMLCVYLASRIVVVASGFHSIGIFM